MTTGQENYVTLLPGMEVYASDGDKVGTISDVTDDSIIVEKGFFFPSDHIIPLGAIEGIDEDDHVYLLVTKDAALSGQWDTNWDAETTARVDPSWAEHTSYGTDRTSGVDPSWAEHTSYGTERSGDLTTSDEESTRVPVYEEELTPVKRAVSRGAVRIQKEVVTENRTIEVPVTEERVRVTHVDTDVPVSADAAGAFEEGYIEVPITGEEVTLEKTARQTGEVVVDKERVRRDESVGGTVRREEVHIDEDTVVDDVDSMNRQKR